MSANKIDDGFISITGIGASSTGTIAGSLTVSGTGSITVPTYGNIVTKLAAIDTAVGMKANSVSPTFTGNVGIGTTSARVALDIVATSAILAPAGTVAQRPTGVKGLLRYNTADDVFEGYSGAGTGAWSSLGAGAGTAVVGDNTKYLEKWKAKLSQTSTGNAVLAIVGDSITQGLNSSDLSTATTGTSYVSRIRTQLQALYGDGGSGFISVNMAPSFFNLTNYTSTQTKVSYSAGWVSANNDGIAGAHIYTNTAGATITFSLVRGSSIRVYYVSSSNTNSFTITIDGGSPTTVNTNKVLPAILTSTTVTGLSTGSHSVVITATGGNYTLIYGVRGTNPTGVIVDNYGFSGQTSGGFASSGIYGAPRNWSGGTNIPSDLLIYAMGVNDHRGLTGFASSATVYENNVKLVFDAMPLSTDLMIALPHIGNWPQEGTNYYDMMDRAIALSQRYNAIFLSHGALYRNSYANFATLNGWGSGTPGVSGSDLIHPSDEGHNLYATNILNIIN